MYKHLVDVSVQVFETELQIIIRREVNNCWILIRCIDSEIQQKIKKSVIFDTTYYPYYFLHIYSVCY